MAKHGLSRSQIASTLEDLSEFLTDAIDKALEDEAAAAASNITYAQGVIDAVVQNI